MGQIYVVRHAQPSDANVTVSSHWTDTELTPLGRQQAACTAERLGKELAGQPVVVHASDLRRASQTAEPIAKALGVGVIPQPGLREFNNGLAVGETEEKLLQFAPKDTAPTKELLANPAGEPWPAFYNRVAGAMAKIVEGDERTIVVVSHYGTIINTLTWWLGIGLNTAGDTPVSFDAGLASIAVLSRNKQGKPRLERLNDRMHLINAGVA